MNREPTVQAPTNREFDQDREDGWLCEASEPLVQPFTGQAKVNIDVDETSHPLDFFQYFINDELLQKWVDSTNRHAFSKYFVTYDLPTHARIRQWQDTTVDEMKVFLALFIATGLLGKADIAKYWSTDPLIATEFFNGRLNLNASNFCFQCFTSTTKTVTNAILS